MYKKLLKNLKRPLAAILMVLFVLCSSIPAFAYDPDPFTDVPSNHWAYQSIMNMVRLGVISGYPDQTFRPDKFVSREEFAKMLCGATSIPLVNPRSNTFADVTKDNWSFRYVETVKDYLTGYPSSSGKPLFLGKQDATREDVAVALVKIKGFDKTTPPNPNILEDMFKDVDSISSNLRNLVSIAVEKKLIQGLPDHTIRGSQALTRAEAAALIDRANRIAGDVKGSSYNSGSSTGANLLSIQVSCSKTVGVIGEKLQATAKGIYSNDSTRDVTTEVEWISSDSSIAAISDDGEAVLKKAGAVTLYAALGNLSDEIDITVVAQGSTTAQEIKFVKITPETKEINVNDTLNLKAEVIYENGSVVNITNDARWESTNSDVAIVSSQGKVVGLKDGMTLIKATYKDVTGFSGLTVSQAVYTPPAAETNVILNYIRLSYSYKELKKGSKLNIKAFGTYSNRSTRDITSLVTWSVENSNVATIDKNGQITAKSDGLTKITASYEGKSYQMYVKVKK